MFKLQGLGSCTTSSYFFEGFTTQVRECFVARHLGVKSPGLLHEYEVCFHSVCGSIVFVMLQAFSQHFWFSCSVV